MPEREIGKTSFLPGKYTALLLVVVLAGLYLASLYSYLLFHSLAELFSIIVAFGIFIITWNSRRFLENNFLLLIGVAFFFIGILDILHTLAYKGMGVFPAFGSDLPTQIWILMRYVTALSFLCAPLFIGRKLNISLVFLGYTVVVALLLVSIIYWQIFPACYIEGVGLTPFKIYSEYIISLFFVGALALLFKYRREFDKGVWQLIAASFIFSIASELAFTLYVDVYGISNLVGHMFEIISFYLIYKAIIETGLTKPYSLLFRSIKEREEGLESTLTQAQQRQNEVAALLEGSRAILSYSEFPEVARSIFNSCKNLVGAKAGYVALLSADGTRNEVLFLESGGLPCRVDPFQPMPIRGLRAEAYRTGKAVYHNDFANSEWVEYLPSGHLRLDSVIFAPLIIENKTVGLLGLANKSGGFSENDARMASAFAELAAIALRNSRMWEFLQQSETRFRTVAQTARDAIITIDSRDNIVLWNQGAENIFNYTADEIVGKPLVTIMPERFREKHQRGVKRFFSGGETRLIGRTVEQVGQRKDGSEFPIELSLASWKAGDAMFVTAIVRDITERKRAEEQLRTYERLATLGTVAGSISHEIRNPLAIIDSSVFFLEGKLKEADERVKSHLKRIHSSVQRSASIIQSLLNLTQMKEPLFKKLDLKVIVSEAIITAGIPEKVRVILNFPEGEVLVNAEREQLHLAFGNIITNALQAMEGKGTLTVTLLRKENEVELSFNDTGPGIPPEHIGRIFQPLFSTKVRGIGFGLAIAKMVAEKHSGSLEAKSQPGVGATFIMRLPLEDTDKPAA